MTMQLDKKMFYLCCLEMSNVEASDAGLYKAVAKNASGESQATINLTFDEGSAAGAPRIPDGVAPRFPMKPTIRQVMMIMMTMMIMMKMMMMTI